MHLVHDQEGRHGADPTAAVVERATGGVGRRSLVEEAVAGGVDDQAVRLPAHPVEGVGLPVDQHDRRPPGVVQGSGGCAVGNGEVQQFAGVGRSGDRPVGFGRQRQVLLAQALVALEAATGQQHAACRDGEVLTVLVDDHAGDAALTEEPDHRAVQPDLDAVGCGAVQQLAGERLAGALGVASSRQQPAETAGLRARLRTQRAGPVTEHPTVHRLCLQDAALGLPAGQVAVVVGDALHRGERHVRLGQPAGQLACRAHVGAAPLGGRGWGGGTEERFQVFGGLSSRIGDAQLGHQVVGWQPDATVRSRSAATGKVVGIDYQHPLPEPMSSDGGQQAGRACADDHKVEVGVHGQLARAWASATRVRTPTPVPPAGV